MEVALDSILTTERDGASFLFHYEEAKDLWDLISNIFGIDW